MAPNSSNLAWKIPWTEEPDRLQSMGSQRVGHDWSDLAAAAAAAMLPGGSRVAQMVNHLPATRESQVQFPGQQDPLEKEMAIHSSTFAWKIPWREGPDRLQSMGSQRVRHFVSQSVNWALSLWLLVVFEESYQFTFDFSKAKDLLHLNGQFFLILLPMS